ncbi:BREX-1 system adenine-specific DNA-methyltransferase PglX [Porphyrobacter sp. GA68]|uniref:BREX-1 system adenine-specific DNA-methyltransferase PglX n=1 Tax=Porphyrobacter sp. GA68 TaxID=2883480 RepID=UPI001D184AF6|nr:BREX-1 system adenine-specific DNA-methyltransferase PglX [Porphyrobacter sp. GA68]
MSESDIDWVARSGKRAKGRRPEYFADPAVDRLTSILMALVGEVSALRERLDTVERLLEAKNAISREDIEAYAPDREAGAERGLATKAFVARVLRAVQQEAEAIEANDPPIEHWVEELGRKEQPCPPTSS